MITCGGKIKNRGLKFPTERQYEKIMNVLRHGAAAGLMAISLSQAGNEIYKNRKDINEYLFPEKNIEWKTYEIKKGDTIWKIAGNPEGMDKRYVVDKIMEKNKIKPEEIGNLKSGEEILVPNY